MKRIPIPAAPLLVLALLLLLDGMWGGLLRIGWQWPTLHVALPLAHGPLMIGGFLGTLISLERVVALDALNIVPRAKALYLGPVASGIGGILLILGFGGSGGAVLIALGSAVMLVIMLILYRFHPSFHGLIMAVGAGAWLIGNLLWLGGQPVPVVVLWWAAFLILTITGERLELSQLLHLTPRTQTLFAAATALFLAGVLLSALTYAAGVRLAGAGMLALAVWLLRFDIARRRLQAGGQAQFVAVGLLAGYVWLGLGGIIAIGRGGMMAGPWYDAWLHAVLLGFVFSMIFAHAPIVFPAVLARPLRYSPAFYLHLAVLHGALILRLAGDLGRWGTLRQWGGLFNAIAILLFMINTALALRRGKR